MHELSLANSILNLTRQRRPERSRVLRVQVEAGPMQGIDPAALAMAWQSLTRGTELANSALDVATLPWTLTCCACGAAWRTSDMTERCRCGSEATTPSGSADVRLMSLDVETEPESQPRSESCTSKSSSTC